VEWLNEPAKWSEQRGSLVVTAADMSEPVTFDDLNVTQAAQPS
jgi:hypothetical protein